jgi:para-aminobenzoate synthetase / 4-amino-4-deoxychorismate lyase
MDMEKRELEPLAVFKSFKGSGSRWNFSFNNPLAVVEAYSIAEVAPVIQWAEQQTRAGHWAVLMLAYEAAHVFDAAMITHPANDFPLAWAATFDNPGELPLPGALEDYQTTDWQAQISRKAYAAAIQKIHQHIENGDTYQVNYTFPLRCNFTGNSYPWFEDLFAVQEANYCAYINLGRFKILSLSPELFFERTAQRLITRPMKGTMPRGRWLEEDKQQMERLRESLKNRAENLMIVDLLRNDLGKISDIGTVKVSSLFEVERYRTVLQMTSTIESVCKPDKSLFDILQALFPCGSITGAPKIRTMEIIRELEDSPRHAYTGTIGVVQPGGDCLFNVAIRTVVIDSQTRQATFNVGGGITYDSTAADEYEECLLKARFLTHHREEFEIFESMLLEEGEIFLLERHMQRLKASAEYFAFPFAQAEALSSLKTLITNYPGGRFKVRIFLKSDGIMRCDIAQVQADSATVQRVKLAAQPVDSSNIFLFHKTTNRKLYQQALQEAGDCDSVIFYNQAGEITEAVTANVVVHEAGKYWTPPRSCGLLSGTFRDELLARGELFERIITAEEFLQSDSIFLINSVRRWMPAKLDSKQIFVGNRPTIDA